MLVNGVVRVMRQLGMMAADVAENAERRTSNVQRRMAEGETPRRSEAATTEDRRSQTVATVLTAFDWVYARNAGMWYSRVKAGDQIQKGQEIGTVGDLFGDVLETIVAPVTGTVLFLTINPSVQTNGLLMGIGVE